MRDTLPLQGHRDAKRGAPKQGAAGLTSLEEATGQATYVYPRLDVALANDAV